MTSRTLFPDIFLKNGLSKETSVNGYLQRIKAIFNDILRI